MIHTKETLASLNLMQLLDSVSDSSGLHLVNKDHGLCAHAYYYDWCSTVGHADLNYALFFTAHERLTLFGNGSVVYPILDLDLTHEYSAKGQYHSLPLWEGKQLELRQQLAAFISYHLASIQL